ncbi:membrane protein [Lactobacillus corticis]|uniref:Membrane protein n=2 Tax=Lactobacillus corticis TaxID=2201249 RepID=A0A916VGZ5_9LACO|nr:BMP family ABC transporter substrate-binding protein [Lactobacillus corticis]GFZ26491.1 membrane protein [Lactobacillus corticis]
MNFKRIKRAAASVLLLSAVGLVLAACSGKKNSSNGKTTEHSIALVTNNTGVDDHSFNQSAWEGLQKYGKKYGLKKGTGGYNYFESSSASDHVPNIEQAINAKYQTIVGVGYELTSAIKSEAKKHPKTNFIMIDNTINAKNVVSATFKSQDSSYLAGIAAAYTTKTNVVGFVGGAHSVIIDMFDAGFTQGVKDGAKAQGKKIKILNQYVGNFTSTDKAKTIAQSMYANKADVIYHAAATAGEGVFSEAKAINQKRSAANKVWVIGVDSDQSSLGAYTDKNGKKSNFTLTSVMKGIGKVCYDIAVKTHEGKFPGGKHLVYGVKGNGTYVLKGNMNAKSWKAVQKAKQAIIAGKVKVPTTPKS